MGTVRNKNILIYSVLYAVGYILQYLIILYTFYIMFTVNAYRSNESD